MSCRQAGVGADQLQPESLSGGGAGGHVRRRRRQPLPVQEARRAVPAQHQREIGRIHLAFRLRSGRRSNQAWLERAEQTTTKQTRSRRVVGLVSRRVAIPRVRAQRRCRREAGRVLPHVHRGAGAVVGRDRVQPACGADRCVSASSFIIVVRHFTSRVLTGRTIAHPSHGCQRAPVSKPPSTVGTYSSPTPPLWNVAPGPPSGSLKPRRNARGDSSRTGAGAGALLVLA